MSTADESGRWTFFSPAVKRILGHEPAEIVSRSAFDFMFCTRASIAGFGG